MDEPGQPGGRTPEGPTSGEASLRDLTVVSNREPFVHSYENGTVEMSRPAGGLVTALDEMVARLGGTWVAWGSGDADFDPGVLTGEHTFVPPKSDGDYALRRVRLTDEQVRRYYYGYSNQVLWPLCHLETEHVELAPGDWTAYREVNRTFADAVVDTAEDAVWLHDYHLGLVPRFVRKRLGLATPTLVHFWHIPWPPLAVFEICPQAEALLRGLLGNDAVGFHVERYRQRFLRCVEALVPEASVDAGERAVHHDGRTVDTYVVPVGVDVDTVATRGVEETAFWDDWLDRRGVPESATLAVGVDRLDYTKGIVERLDALDRLWSEYPGLRGDLAYVQKATKTRERIPSYSRYHRRVLDRVEAINRDHGTADWTPVCYTDDDLTREQLTALYRRADACLVTSRRDGLNLVAEEFVAASQEHPGALVLSEFAGVAELLGDDAILVNPFDVGGLSEGIHSAVTMGEAERRRRLDGLVASVRDHSLSAWIDHHESVFAGCDDAG
ncbi:trehalose-6-phosphate synthase [Halobacteriales archaeon Cl-PHB]